MTGLTLPSGGPRPWARPTVELTLFVALGAFAVAQWARLVAGPPAGRLVLALAIITVGAAVLWKIGERPRPFARLAAAAVAIAALVASLVAVGLDARLLAPPNWSELIENLSLGLAGIEDTEMPYTGDDEWLRLTLLLGAPLLLALAASLAFWPTGGRATRRALAVGPLIAIYGIAVTLDSPGSELLWGVPLLLLVAAWLWLPDLSLRRAAVAIAAVAGAGVLALPVAAKLDPGAAWWDYESWDWFGRDREVSFDWNHSYGPLEWPREGTTLLEVRSTEALYWKASVLDRFDGFTWQRAQGEDASAAPERLARRQIPGGQLPDRRRDWLTQASFEVEALSSGLVIGAGTPLAVQGVAGVELSSDGTLSGSGQLLESGEEYSILAYAPQPTVDELRRAPPTYPERRFASQALVGLPATVAPVFEDGGFAPPRAHAMPLWGEPADPGLRAVMLSSPYSGVYRLARRLVAGAETPYQGVRAIERHLRHSYAYTPTVPEHTYPLAAFLFEDEAGYCQQFAGAMALMLRMVGIPSRVVSGFAPGSFDSERDLYEVRDLDAHSWVEAYFRGIGWVTFDPTPAAAPAASQTISAEIGSVFRGRGSIPAQGRARQGDLERASEGGGAGGTRAGDGTWEAVATGALGLGALGAVAIGIVCRRRRRRLASGAAVEAQLAELRRALERLGWSVPVEATLLGLEQRFLTAGRPAVSGYVAGLRAHRYAPGAPPPPGPPARRALRRALSSGGLRRRLRALLVIPPGGPR